MPKFIVIDGYKDRASHVCTWCAASYITRGALERHWKKTPQCGRNKGVSNPTQSKYNDVVEPSGESTDT